MDGFTIIDGVVALVIILSALLAYSRGVVREGLAIAGWILAAVLAFMFAPQVQPLVKEIPVVGEFIADSCELSMLGAAFVVAALVLVLASLFAPLFSSMVQKSILGGLDQGLGFLFGVVRGVLLVAITFFVYETVAVGQEVAMVDNSRSAKVFASMTGKIEERDPSASLGWITSKYEALVSSCEL
ncbi:MAG: CvpA family protein [Thalassovita mediterranea]|jgi:membrane protein required for colicin V production|uniref:CvpA family protein n=1 Tax=Thalassovita mediterranea TaxID=340021 RepID=UPI003C32C470|nr:CvpA family protein [Phaeobacter sp. CNT1-3]